MARIGLIIYLVLMGRAELICPCTALPFVMFHSLGTSGEIPSCPCCPDLPASAKGLPSGMRSPSGPQCPCQARAENLPLRSVPNQQARKAAGKVRDCLYPAPLHWLPNDNSLNANLWSSVRVDGAFLSPRDRLRVICLMRC
jgi:hypothetical protein